MSETKPVLCGFVWCHGNKDLSAYTVTLRENDLKKIEEILSDYECEGYSERNVWNRKFSDVFCEDY